MDFVFSPLLTSVVLHDLPPEEFDCLLCLSEVSDWVEGVLIIIIVIIIIVISIIISWD